MLIRFLVTLVPLSVMLGACAPKNATDSSSSAASARTAAAASAGQRIFDGNCVACHQSNGAGIPGVYPSLAGSPIVLGDPAVLAKWVVSGERPASMPAGRYPTQMLQFGWMQPADAAAVLTTIRSSFGNHAPAVDEATVAKALGR